MLKSSLYLLAGAIAVNQMPALPPEFLALAALLFALGLLLMRSCRPFALVVLGASLMTLAANRVLEDRLANAAAALDTVLTVRVLDFAKQAGDAISFVGAPVGRADLPARIRISWFETRAKPAPGEHWRLRLRLRAPRGAANPGGFDTEGWLFRQRIGATGYVVNDAHNYRLAGVPTSVVDRIRRSVNARIATTLPDDDAAAVLVAVSAGARHRISRDMWERFAATGTSHLMAISGLHVGMAAAIGYLFLRIAAALFGHRGVAQDVGVVGALLVAAGYAVISGSAIPAERALAMISGAAIFRLLRRDVEPLQILGTVAVLLFVADPIVVLAPGFSLSFAAVLLLLISGLRLGDVQTGNRAIAAILRPALGLLRIQVVLLAGLFSLSVIYFDRITILGPMTNLLVLPLFNLTTVPLTLAGALLDGSLSPAGDVLLHAAHRGTAIALDIVGYAAALDHFAYQIASQESLWPVFVPVLFALLPAGWPARRVALIAACLVINDRPDPPLRSCVDLYYLDVGQGLAVVARTRTGTLVYDTGPAYRSGGDAAAAVVVPFLHRLGITFVDDVVISHGDLDHAGGARSLIESIGVGSVMVSESLDFVGNLEQRCVAGQAWRRDGIEFLVLHPKAGSPWVGNNRSCVLEIRAGRQRALLTGDIEKPVEQLMTWRQELSPGFVVTVPHHGSRTSSTAAMTAAIRPRFAIVSAGYGNRWGFPKADVVSRWRAVGATVLNTAESGAISMSLCAGQSPGPVLQWASRERRYWHTAREWPGPMR